MISSNEWDDEEDQSHKSDEPHKGQNGNSIGTENILPKQAGNYTTRVHASDVKQRQEKVEILNRRPRVNVKLYEKGKNGPLDSGTFITLKRLCPLIRKKRADFRKNNADRAA